MMIRKEVMDALETQLSRKEKGVLMSALIGVKVDAERLPPALVQKIEAAKNGQ